MRAGDSEEEEAEEAEEEEEEEEEREVEDEDKYAFSKGEAVGAHAPDERLSCSTSRWLPSR